MDDPGQRDAERQARIEALESRLSRRSPAGVRAEASLICAALAALALWLFLRQDLAYFFSPRAAISLGREGDYRFDALANDRYVMIHGTPTTKGAYFREGDDSFVVVGLRDTPVLVRRPTLSTEHWVSGAPPPQPDQRPFAVAGRLMRRKDARKYEQAFAQLGAGDEVRPAQGSLWILLEGEKPGEDRGAALVGALLVAFIALNLGLAWRDLRHRAARRSATG